MLSPHLFDLFDCVSLLLLRLLLSVVWSARIGGESFFIVLRNLSGVEGVEDIPKETCQSFSGPLPHPFLPPLTLSRLSILINYLLRFKKPIRGALSTHSRLTGPQPPAPHARVTSKHFKRLHDDGEVWEEDVVNFTCSTLCSLLARFSAFLRTPFMDTLGNRTRTSTQSFHPSRRERAIACSSKSSSPSTNSTPNVLVHLTTFFACGMLSLLARHGFSSAGWRRDIASLSSFLETVTSLGSTDLWRLPRDGFIAARE